MTNEQTLLQTVLLLHSIQVPSPHQIVSEQLSKWRPFGLCKTTYNHKNNQKITTLLQTASIETEKKERKGTLLRTCLDVKFKLHATTVETKRRMKQWTSPDDLQTFKLQHFPGRNINKSKNPRENLHFPDETGRWYKKERENWSLPTWSSRTWKDDQRDWHNWNRSEHLQRITLNNVCTPSNKVPHFLLLSYVFTIYGSDYLTLPSFSTFLSISLRLCLFRFEIF